MKIGAYQFAVKGDIKYNFESIKKAILQASNEQVELLVLPECALTGYPPHNIERASEVDFNELTVVSKQLQQMSSEHNIHIVVGSVTKVDEKHYDSAIIFSPNKERKLYHKRALWGWDKDNFSVENNSGVFELANLKIGIRICYEVRFPEFFRELYARHTDLNIILFYDVADYDDIERYDLIKAHIRTRAVENVCHTLSVNTIKPYQTAPTALFDKSGGIIKELERNAEGLLIYDLVNTQDTFGEQGRRVISDRLVL